VSWEDGERAIAWAGTVGVRLAPSDLNAAGTAGLPPLRPVDDLDGKRLYLLDERSQPPAASAPVGAVVALAPRERGEPELRRLAPAEAVPALLANTSHAGLAGPDGAFALATRLAAQAPMFRLRLADDLAVIGEAADALLDGVLVGAAGRV
jgi:hypothetical protein